MVFQRVCSFCGADLEPGTGKMYVKKDGTVYYFCRSKCQKNMLKLGRAGREIKWTRTYRKSAGKEVEVSEEKPEEVEEEVEIAKKPKKFKKLKKV